MLSEDDIISNRKHNQEYLKLDDIEILLHEVLMKTPMNMLPQSLGDYLNRKHTGDAICGDALSCWVADWIRLVRVSKENPSKLDMRLIMRIGTRVEKLHKTMSEFMSTVSFDDKQDPKVDKRCGTCRNYMPNKKRVWTCLNCGEDISCDVEGQYFHVKDDCFLCEGQSTKVAIPKPDSERWIET